MKYVRLVFGGCLLVTLHGCSKDDFLTRSPSSDILAPTTPTQLEGMLNNVNLFKQTPAIGEQSADTYYLWDPLYRELTAMDVNLYTWQADIYGAEVTINDWNTPYTQVYNANVVLDKLAGISPSTTNQEQLNTIRGTALFMRSYAFHQVALVFAPQYDARLAEQQAGIVLALEPNLHERYSRATLQATYARIVSDLLVAKDLLPARLRDTTLPLPDKAAACALLARVYLTMADYDNAQRWADNALAYRPALTDYNTVSLTDKLPFSGVQTEILYPSSLIAGNVLQVGRKVCVIDSALYGAYDTNDLRKYIYFKFSSLNQPVFKGSYTGDLLAFSGLATDEMYLIRAECYARHGNIPLCLKDINTLLAKRYKTGTYVPYTSASAPEALRLVLDERKKELVFRGLRWSDLKRLNAEGDNITLTRLLDGRRYMLTPTSNRYVLPIPNNVLAGSDITQNPRN